MEKENVLMVNAFAMINTTELCVKISNAKMTALEEDFVIMKELSAFAKLDTLETIAHFLPVKGTVMVMVNVCQEESANVKKDTIHLIA